MQIERRNMMRLDTAVHGWSEVNVILEKVQLAHFRNSTTVTCCRHLPSVLCLSIPSALGCSFRETVQKAREDCNRFVMYLSSTSNLLWFNGVVMVSTVHFMYIISSLYEFRIAARKKDMNPRPKKKAKDTAEDAD